MATGSLALASSRKPAARAMGLPLAELLDIMVLSRESDKREAILFRQGRATFQLPSAGHEAVAALAYALEGQDLVFPYYRDKALMLARGTSLEQIALDYFAKQNSSSGGRQMASHFCDRGRNMVSCGTPTGMQCLPAAGAAWGMKLSGQRAVVVCCIGDAATRQGEFYEALCFSLQERLPIVFVVEDNGYGVSTSTERMTPYVIDALSKAHCVPIDGRDANAVYEAARRAVDEARFHHQPSVLYLSLDRLMSHTSSDDHRIYRSALELASIEVRDPLHALAARLQKDGVLTGDGWARKCSDAARKVCSVYEQAEKADDPDPGDITTHIFSGSDLKPAAFALSDDKKWAMAEAVNAALRFLLTENGKVILFGEDIADPKGGVFGLTKGLSSAFPHRVFNSPLAEATICGVAAGLSLAGRYIPVFELQFIDFVGPAFNQLVNQIATLRWRTLGRYVCPMVILAPCGAYLGRGGPWHSQTNEAWFAHAPGLKIAMPSDPYDAAEIITAAAHGDDPTLVLLPKNLFFKEQERQGAPSLYPGQPKIRRLGKDLTIVAWGNCVDIALEAADSASSAGISAEIIDPRFIAPCDLSVIRSSVRKTGRLMVVQEDNRTCSFGQSLIADLIADTGTWNQLKAPPWLVSRDDVHIGFHSRLEAAVLPHKDRLSQRIRALVGEP
jgi:2-oxoisovalerate dehydrogenase E1 component